MTNNEDQQQSNKKPTNHWILWTLVAVFIVGAITAMVLVDYYYAPGTNGNADAPKDAADK